MPHPLFEIWARRGLGYPVLIHNINYEPRAIRHCEVCDHVLIGTKDGRLLSLSPTGPLQVVSPVGPAQPVYGVRAIVGCARGCPGSLGYAMLGDGAGQIFRTTTRDGVPVLELLTTVPDERVFSMTEVPGLGVTLLCASARVWLIPQPLQADESPRLMAEIPRPVRWLFPNCSWQTVDPDQRFLWLIGPDGTVMQLRHEGPAHRLVNMNTPMRHLPVCLGTDRENGVVKGIFYGSSYGTRLWLPQAAGLGQHAEFSLGSGGPTWFVRRLRMFRDQHGNQDYRLVAAHGRGDVRSWPWPPGTSDAYRHHSGALEPAVSAWPRLPGELVNLVMYGQRGEVQDADAPPAPTQAILFVREHQLFSLSLYDYHALARMETLRAGLPRAHGSIGDIELRGRVNELEGRLRAEAPSEEAATAVTQESAALLASATGVRPEKLIYQARRLRVLALTLLRRQSGDAHTAPWRRLVAWARFLKKHYTLASTYDNAQDNLSWLMSVNAKRDTADALLYAARYLFQQTDIYNSWRLDAAPIALGMHPGRKELAVTLRDGRVLARPADAASDAEINLLAAPDWIELRGPSAGGRPPRHSNVIVPYGDAWLIAPTPMRGQEATPGKDRGPLETGKDLIVLHHQHASHAATVVNDHVLLGQRSNEAPILCITGLQGREWRAASNGPPNRAPSGWPRHRVLVSLTQAPWAAPGTALVALGDDEGVVRLLSYNAETASFGPTEPPPLTLGSQVLAGAAVVPMASDDELLRRGPTLPVFAFGTAAGDLFVFELLAADNGHRLRLVFRDQLYQPIRALTAVDGDIGTELVVLDGGGRIGFYLLSWRTATSERFFGRRLAQTRILDEGTALVGLADGTVAAAGRVGEDWQVRVLRRRRPPLTHDALRPYLNRALVVTRAMGLDDQTGLRLLANLPQKDGSIAAALLPFVLPESPDAIALAAILSDALAARPDDRLVFKVLIDLHRERLTHWEDDADPDLRCQALVPLIETLGAPGRRAVWMGVPRLRAALARKITCTALFRLASPQQAEQDARKLSESVRGWMGDLLRDDYPLVQMSTMQALSATLTGIASNSDYGERMRQAHLAFPPIPGQPSVTGARWLIAMLAEQLRTWPPGEASEVTCTASVWATIMGVIHLLRVYRDSAMAILHRLAELGVNAHVFGIIRHRVIERWPAHHPVQSAVRLYMPALGAPQLFDAVLHHLDLVIQAPMPSDPCSPDGLRLQAQQRVYRFLRRLGEAIYDGRLRELDIDDLAGDDWPLSALSITQKDHTGFAYFHVTRSWLREHLGPPLQRLREGRVEVSPETAFHALFFASGPADSDDIQPEKPAFNRLYEPERTLIRVLFRQLKGVLYNRVPTVGSTLQGWRLGNLHPGVRAIFNVDAAPAPTDPGEVLIFAETQLTREVAQDRGEQYIRLKEAAEACKLEVPYAPLPVREVLLGGAHCWLVMQRLSEHYPKADRWPEPRPELPSPEWVVTHVSQLHRWSEVLATALLSLHSRDLYHGDVSSRNVLVANEGCWLIDYEHMSWSQAARRQGLRSRTRSGPRPQLRAAFSRIYDQINAQATADDIGPLTDLISLAELIVRMLFHVFDEQDLERLRRYGLTRISNPDEQRWASSLTDIAIGKLESWPYDDKFGAAIARLRPFVAGAPDVVVPQRVLADLLELLFDRPEELRTLLYEVAPAKANTIHWHDAMGAVCQRVSDAICSARPAPHKLLAALHRVAPGRQDDIHRALALSGLLPP